MLAFLILKIKYYIFKDIPLYSVVTKILQILICTNTQNLETRVVDKRIPSLNIHIFAFI